MRPQHRRMTRIALVAAAILCWLSTLFGGIAYAQTESPTITLFSHRQGEYVESGVTFYRDNFYIRGQTIYIALDIANEGTGTLIIASATVTTINCTVELQESFPLSINPGAHPGIRPYTTIHGPGPWGFTVTLNNNSNNAPAFVFSFASDPFGAFDSEPAGTAGTILDRGIPSGQAAPMDGTTTVSAIYQHGEDITGAVRIMDAEGNPILDFEAQFSLVKRYTSSTGPHQTSYEAALLEYDAATQLYRFSFDSGVEYQNAPLIDRGFYDVRVALPDGTDLRERIQIR